MTFDHLPCRRKSVRISQRTAITLIEVLGTLSVLLVLGLAAVSILGKVTDIGVRTNLARQGRASIERLAPLFRDDVRHAQQINLSQTDGSIEIVRGQQQVQYSWRNRPATIFRRVTQAETQSSVDRFTLPDPCRPACFIDDDIVSLRLSAEGQPQPWMIEVRRP